MELFRVILEKLSGFSHRRRLIRTLESFKEAVVLQNKIYLTSMDFNLDQYGDLIKRLDILIAQEPEIGLKLKTNTPENFCGCGRRGRYFVMEDGEEVISCNKISRCRGDMDTIRGNILELKREHEIVADIHQLCEVLASERKLTCEEINDLIEPMLEKYNGEKYKTLRKLWPDLTD